MKMKSLRFVLTAMVIAMLPQQGIADGHKKTMWDVITNDDRFATFAVMVENAGVEHLFNGKNSNKCHGVCSYELCFLNSTSSHDLSIKIPRK